MITNEILRPSLVAIKIYYFKVGQIYHFITKEYNKIPMSIT